MFWLILEWVKLIGFTWILWTTERETNVLTEVGVSEVGRIHLNLVNNRERETNVLTEVGVSEVGRIHLNLVNNRER